MLRLLLLPVATAVVLTAALAAGTAADTVQARVAGRDASNPFTRKQCNICYYHYSIGGLHIVGGFSLNLPLQAFTDPRPSALDGIEKPEEFAMELLPDLSIGYQKEGTAFFLKLEKSYLRPRFQMYFKLWI